MHDTGHQHTHGHSSHGHGAHDEGHGGTGKYWVVFVLLCILTGASFFTYSAAWPFHDRPAIGWTFMMVVSCTKALLVILFFMHLLWEAKWKYVLTIPAGMMSIFLVLMLVPDIGMRVRRYSEERLEYAAIPTMPHHDAGDEKAEGESGEQH